MRWSKWFLFFLASGPFCLNAQSSPWQVVESKPVQPIPIETQSASSSSSTNTVWANSASLSDQRINVLECSPEEVNAYFVQPDRAREVLNNYGTFEKAYRQAEQIRSENDPAACAAMLYGDLEAMADQLKDSISGIFDGGMPDLSAIAQKAMEKLGESICKRVKETENSFRDRVITESRNAREMAKSEVIRRYGPKALDKYLTDAVISEDMQDAGLEFRGGTIDTDRFKRNSKSRWKRELDELQDSAVDDISGG